MKPITSYCFTATNTVRSAAIITVLVLSLSAAHGENLTTLDGKTYTNITDISKYPKQLFFNCDSNRIGVTITNLPEDFRAKYGIIIKTNTPMVSVPQIPADPTNLFLWQNSKTDLYQLEMDHFSTNDSIGITTTKYWHLMLKGVEVSFTVDTDTHYHDENLKNREDSQEMHFEVGREVFISQLFNRFFDWAAVATTNHAENFEKEIARRVANQSNDYEREMSNALYGGQCVYIFSWEGGQAKLHVKDVAPYGGYFEDQDIQHFQKLLEHLPDMKQKLVAAIRNKEAQKDLFK
jgi:hypothetical protein